MHDFYRKLKHFTHDFLLKTNINMHKIMKYLKQHPTKRYIIGNTLLILLHRGKWILNKNTLPL